MDNHCNSSEASNSSNHNHVPSLTPYILTVDVGTTSLRSHLYDKNACIRGTGSKKVETLHPQTGWCELDPYDLFNNVTLCIKELFNASGIRADQVTCLGIATFRATFITWDRETGRPFHNFICWNDLRSKEFCRSWNKSYSLKALNAGSKFLHYVTRKSRFMSASILRFFTLQVTMRLLWQLENVKQLRERASQGQVMFGTIDTWLLWKLTGEKVHATDYSCASSTGLYDPFVLDWSSILCNMLSIPMSIFPKVQDTSGLFGTCDPAIFGCPIPITCLAADQQSAMFGECCFDIGDIKCTMGSGTFLDLNTGSKPHGSMSGIYPLIAWKIDKEIVFIAEGSFASAGTVLDWGKTIDLFDDVSDTSDVAYSVSDNGGVYFVPAFSGLQAPINDHNATTTIIGLTPETRKAHIIRAMLESLAFCVKLIYETVLIETKIPLGSLKVDGGVTNNDFVMQLIADLTNQTVERSTQTDKTSLGAAFFAGLASGVWKSKDELRAFHSRERLFEAKPTWVHYKAIFHQWERAVNRSKQWYKSDEK